MADDDVITTERDGDVALITLQRPRARNAVNQALAQAICDAVDAAQDAACIVITGADPAFCAGLDLRDLGADMAELAPFNATVAGSGVPCIAAVNGPAVTGGFELALCCDFIVASERAVFADTHVRVGVYPGPVMVDLPRRVGLAWAKEMSLTGNFVDAATALRIGIANHVVPHDECVPFAMTLAKAIAEQPRAMVAAMRDDWKESVGVPIEQGHEIHSRHGRERGRAAGHPDLEGNRDAVLARSKRQRGEA